MKINPIWGFPIFCFSIFPSCDGNKFISTEIDTPTTGKISVAVDENVSSLADALIDAFESSYPTAFLIESYSPEKNVIQELYDDSSRLAIMTRRLSVKESLFFEAQKYIVEELKIGSDAVVFLVNKNNPVASFTINQIREIISGEDSLWSQIRADSKLGRINIVFDNASSSNLRYLADTLLGGGGLGKNCFALSTNDSVIKYVSASKNTIGVVGLNWIGDKDSEEDVARREKIAFCAVGKSASEFFFPNQSNIATGDYPFSRGVWLIKIGKRAGLGTGFASFCLGERGQLIVQRSGLVPAKPAERKVKITVKQ